MLRAKLLQWMILILLHLSHHSNPVFMILEVMESWIGGSGISSHSPPVISSLFFCPVEYQHCLLESKRKIDHQHLAQNTIFKALRTHQGQQLVSKLPPTHLNIHPQIHQSWQDPIIMCVFTHYRYEDCNDTTTTAFYCNKHPRCLDTNTEQHSRPPIARKGACPDCTAKEIERQLAQAQEDKVGST